MTEAKGPGQRAYETMYPHTACPWRNISPESKRSWSAVERACREAERAAVVAYLWKRQRIVAVPLAEEVETGRHLKEEP